MYCIHCGVRLADTEKKCPLCNTEVYHPQLQQPHVPPLYPQRLPGKRKVGPKALNGVLLFLFMIPLLITFFADLQDNGKLNWFGFAAGGIVLGYILLALPLWFRKPNPVIFVPCRFAAAAAYLLYIQLATGSHWFLGFALPLTGGLCIILTTLAALLRYVRGGRLYIWGGTIMALGPYFLLIELLLGPAFGIGFKGWSLYPLCVLMLLGGLLFFLAINRAFREMMERKLFF